jgi:preprotein translocase subunit SecY
MLRKALQFLRHLWAAEDLKNRILITIGLLILYRIAAHIPVAGANPLVLKQIFQNQNSTVLNFLDLLSGGAISNFSVMAMGPYPYITAQIILQLLTPMIPAWERRTREDPQGAQRWMERMTYYFAVPMAALQSISQIGLINMAAGNGASVIDFGFNLNSFAVIATMTAGTMFAIWLGELISEFGIRNQGLSLIIFAGIVAKIPSNIGSMVSDQTHWLPNILIYGAVTISVIALIIFIQQGRRNIPVMYPGRRVGFRQAMPVRANLPLLVNMAGMIPLIFAGAIIGLPSLLAGWLVQFVPDTTNWFHQAAISINSTMNMNTGWYWLMYFVMVVGLTFFYTDVQFSQMNYSENLRRSGAQIPGVTAGNATQRYLTQVLRRITLPGALFLGLVAILPFLIKLLYDYGQNTNMMLVTSNGLLIVVGVVRELYFNMEAELKLRGYEDTALVK